MGDVEAVLHTVAFTGYRPQKMPIATDYADLRLRLRSTIQLLIDLGYTHFISGGALGFDTMTADTVLFFRERYPITLEMAIPFPEQASKWSTDDQAHWRRLCSQADAVSTISDRYDKGCMFRRNHYMIQNSALLLACYDGQPGGTKMTIDLARQMHKQVLIVPPLLA